MATRSFEVHKRTGPADMGLPQREKPANPPEMRGEACKTPLPRPGGSSDSHDIAVTQAPCIKVS